MELYCFTCHAVTLSFLSTKNVDGKRVEVLRCIRCHQCKNHITLYEVKNAKEEQKDKETNSEVF